jgi:serine/threonine-protein kinase
MAEILLARERSLVGGSRHLVIKRVLPEVREFDQMLHMFLDESRVVMGLSHPNLCQIYEVGEQEGAWFIAMEWVNGVTLHQLTRRANELADLDYRVVARVAAQCAEALHYAHAARDADGQLMNLVHRDVSPHNLIVAYDGRVKLLDFGIAKSTTTTHRTEAGVVKGKICYMAPEQWLSQSLDARTDVFGLGICLYEALAGRMLFKRESQSDVMKAVLSGDVAPLSEVAPQVPGALAVIAHRALQTNPDLRFQSANEMAEALERFVASEGEPLSAAHVARYTRRLFRSEVQLGPVLERSLRAAQFAPSNELLLPPLPASLFGMAGPRPRSVPPPFACTPALSLPTAADPVWSDQSEHGIKTALIDDVLEPRVPSIAPEPEGEAFTESSTRRTIPSLPAPEPEPGARSAARTLSMRVGPRMRRAVLSAALLLALPLAWVASRDLRAPLSASMAQLPSDAAPRVGAFPMPAFTLLPPSAPMTAAPEPRQATAGKVEPRHLGKLSINTRPWSTVYLGSRLLGSTPLADVAVPRGALMLKLVDRDGRVHLRRIPASSRTERTAHFDF